MEKLNLIKTELIPYEKKYSFSMENLNFNNKFFPKIKLLKVKKKIKIPLVFSNCVKLIYFYKQTPENYLNL